MSDSDFQKIGELGLRTLVNDFVDSMFDDFFIGFLFARANRERVKQMEYEHLAEFLGAPLLYSGKALDKAHRPHRIRRGQFERRLILFEEVCRRHDIDRAIEKKIIAHHVSLRDQILHASPSC